MKRERIAVVGGGVAGIVASHVLSKNFDVTVFEESHRLGGHACSVKIKEEEREFFVDTAFLIFNSHTYPFFHQFLKKMNLLHTISDSPMSIGIWQGQSNLIYAVNSGLRAFFQQPKNFLNLKMYKLIFEIMRFRFSCREMDFKGDLGQLSFSECLRINGYSDFFAECFAYPLGASVWSLPRESIMELPAKLFIQFFSNHNLMKQLHGAKWQTMKGGSIQYVEEFQKNFEGIIKLNQKIHSIMRTPEGCFIQSETGEREFFDYLVLATPADISLKLLTFPSKEEEELLGVWTYKPCEGVLHTDESIFPRIAHSWPSWNIKSDVRSVTDKSYQVSYYLNRIQGFEAKKNYFMTLGDVSGVQEEKVLQRFQYSHITFSQKSLELQGRLSELNSGRTFFCGSYFGQGFHEGAIKSALEVAAHFNLHL